MSNPVLETLKLPVKENGVITPTVFDIPQGTVTEEMLNEAEGTKADAIVRTASGEIASYDDGGDLPMKSLNVNIVPKQSGSGDPSPQNIRPISGTDDVTVYKTGVNIWDEVAEKGSINSSGERISSTVTLRSKNYIPCNDQEQYFCTVGNVAVIYFYDENKTFIPYTGADAYQNGYNGTGAFTPPTGARYMLFRLSNSYGTTYNNDVAINHPATDTTYHPYNSASEIKSITLPQTVYGGTLDAVSGKLKPWKRQTLNITWTRANNNIFYHDFTEANYLKPYDVGTTPPWECEIFKPASFTDTYTNRTNNTIATTANGHRLWIVTDATDDPTELQNLIKDYYICLEPLTPTEIDLTPTEVKSLLGDNNVWSDSGTVEVEYRADTSLVINKILEALQ